MTSFGPGPGRLAVLFGAAVCCASLATTAAAARTPAPRVEFPSNIRLSTTYGWPLKPFDHQHSIRGGFGDPRFGRVERNFHFGVDIPAPEGTRVYAVAPGRAYWSADHVEVLFNIDFRRRTFSGFEYWHITPAVRGHSFVRRGQLVGYVRAPWNHVHFAQLVNNRWVNPLRARGGLRPYVDHTSPKIDSVQVRVGGRATTTFPAGTSATIVASAYAVPPRPLPPPPWNVARVSPSLIRWRLVGPAGPSRWRTAIDFRRYLPQNRLFSTVYATGTSGNGPGRSGSYLFYLDRGTQTARLAAGRYRVEVEAFSVRGRRAEASTAFTVAAPARR